MVCKKLPKTVWRFHGLHRYIYNKYSVGLNPNLKGGQKV